MRPYIIFFRGLDGLIDQGAAERLANNRGCAAVFYRYAEWPAAAQHVGANPDAPYHVVGFSRGAAPDVIGGFMSAVRRHEWRLPEDLMTVGLYGPIGGGLTPRYIDPHFECINYLDESGQRHVGEHNAVNLGAHVPHLGPGSGMELVADKFAHGRNPLASAPGATSQPTAPSPPLAEESWRGGTGGAASSSDAIATGAAGPLPDAPPQAGEGAERASAPTTSSVILAKQSWPSQAHAAAFYGKPGSPGWVAAHLVDVQCPWTLHMGKVPQHHIQIHKLCGPSLTRVLVWVWDICGKDEEKIAALRYDRFSGSYNYRPMRGGSALSMHAYGAAIDWDDADNAQHSRKHLFTANSPLIKAFLDESWEWGGNWPHRRNARPGRACEVRHDAHHASVHAVHRDRREHAGVTGLLLAGLATILVGLCLMSVNPGHESPLTIVAVIIAGGLIAWLSP